MKLHLLHLEDDDTDLAAAALEAQLVGPELDRLAAELTSLRGAGDPARTLVDVFGAADLTSALSAGLRGVDRVKLRALLKEPRLLAELRDTILAEGGPYWDPLIEQGAGAVPDLDARLARQQASLRGWIANQGELEPASIAAARMRWSDPWVVASLSCAATLLIALGVWRFTSGGGAQSAWTSPELFAAAEPQAYFERLSRAAEAMSPLAEKTPATTDALIRKLAMIKHGCTLISLHDHASLSPAGQEFLLAQCNQTIKEVDAEWYDLLHGHATGDVQLRVQQTMHDLARHLATPPPAALAPALLSKERTNDS